MKRWLSYLAIALLTILIILFFLPFLFWAIEQSWEWWKDYLIRWGYGGGLR